MMLDKDDIETLADEIVSAVARDDHWQHGQPVWATGRSRSTKQLVRFEIEDWLRHKGIEFRG